jgi:hypothetical protein
MRSRSKTRLKSGLYPGRITGDRSRLEGTHSYSIGALLALIHAHRFLLEKLWVKG